MEQEIKFNTIGKIIQGRYNGWYLKILNDTEDTGGYYIIEFKDLEKELKKERYNGFDTWLETIEDVKAYISESNWVISWDFDQ